MLLQLLCLPRHPVCPVLAIVPRLDFGGVALFHAELLFQALSSIKLRQRITVEYLFSEAIRAIDFCGDSNYGAPH